MWSGGLHSECAQCHFGHNSGCGERYLPSLFNICLICTKSNILQNTAFILHICLQYLFVFYLFFSGTTDISFMDPVLIGRNVFSVANDTVGGITGYIQDTLCAILDTTLDLIKGTKAYFNLCVVYMSYYHICII